MIPDEKSKTSKMKKRIVLVLDSFCDRSSENWMNIVDVNHEISLQEYISKHKSPLSEREALLVFYEIVKVVEFIHSRGIIHRDLKLQNFLINLQTRRVTLTNFCLGKLLSSENQLLCDQRGSPAYISPDVLNGPYRGKPADLWTLGVILYILVYGSFPFVENTTASLFKKIRQCELVLPNEGVKVSDSTKRLIKNHLLTASTDRFTATEVREYLDRQFEKIQRASATMAATAGKDDQVVPDISNISTELPKVICSETRPKFDLSREPITGFLKMMSPTQQEHNKMFLKPSLLAERCNRISMPPSDSSDHISPSHVGLTRTLTTQINNLTVRNRQHNNSGLSWHNRISTSGLYEVRFRTSSVESMMMDRSRVRAAGNSSSLNPSFDAINTTLNDLFSSGNFPSNAIVHEFHGNINQDIALKLSIWLRTNFHDNDLVREIYQSTHSPGDDIGRFVEFLRRCSVQMELINGQIFVKAQQTNQHLIFLTYLLQLAGYNNNYFLNLSRNN